MIFNTLAMCFEESKVSLSKLYGQDAKNSGLSKGTILSHNGVQQYRFHTDEQSTMGV